MSASATLLPGSLADDDDGIEYEVASDNCITLSGVPRPQWANLAVLDQIKSRNKATEAEKEKVKDSPQSMYSPCL